MYIGLDAQWYSLNVLHIFGTMVISACNTIFFFFNDTATTEIYTLSLHDALPISDSRGTTRLPCAACSLPRYGRTSQRTARSEEHTSELQSQSNLVCRLLLEKKKKRRIDDRDPTGARPEPAHAIEPAGIVGGMGAP